MRPRSRTIGFLNKALQDEDPEIRYAAIGTLSKIGGESPQAAEVIRKLLSSPESGIRMSAVRVWDDKTEIMTEFSAHGNSPEDACVPGAEPARQEDPSVHMPLDESDRRKGRSHCEGTSWSSGKNRRCGGERDAQAEPVALAATGSTKILSGPLKSEIGPIAPKWHSHRRPGHGRPDRVIREHYAIRPRTNAAATRAGVWDRDRQEREMRLVQTLNFVALIGRIVPAQYGT